MSDPPTCRDPAPDAGPRPSLLIVGASARAAAFSALRAGFAPVCCDQFADADLSAVAPAVRVAHYPGDLVAAAAQFPDRPLLYTGGLENHPDLVAQLAAGRLLLGCSVEALQAIRDPHGVGQALRDAKLPTLECRRSDDPPPADGSWLLKPLRSAGGLGIVAWTPEAADAPTTRVPHYFQRRLEGRPCSAVFIARESVGDVRFVGVTEQLVGEEFCNSGGFAWCGNIGPVALSVAVESAVRRLANFLKWKYHLRGLFGVDFIVGPDDSVGLTEINPRYPASVELLEFSTGVCLLLDHWVCFDDAIGGTPPVDWQPLPSRVLGKAVVYSRGKVAIQRNRRFSPDVYRTWPRLMDVPASGTIVRTGEPICTVTASADSVEGCRQALRASAAGLLGDS